MMTKIAKFKILAYSMTTLALLPVCSNAFVPYEINNREFIHLHGMKVEKKAFHKFQADAIASVHYVEVKDVVATKQASTNNQVSTNSNDDMVMFDYSKKEESKLPAKTIDQKLYDRPLSSAVRNAIKREIGNDPSKTLMQKKSSHFAEDFAKEAIKDTNANLDQEQDIEYDYSVSDAVKRKESSVAAFMNPEKNESPEESQFVLKAKEINLNTHKHVSAHSFEFIPDYERTERADDGSSGEISFDYSLNGDMNTQTGIIQAPGMIPTRVELNLGLVDEMEVPLINEEGIQLFLQKQGLSIEGNLILLAIDSSIADVELDSHFAQRFYFDDGFNLLPSSAEASYVMFAGVKSGNIMLRYLLSNKESAQKVVYVGDGEMYFEDPSFNKGQRETFIFTTRSLLGQKKKELVIDGSDILFFNTSVTAKKKALNAYEMKIPTLVSGMRKYFEFKHLGESIFLGTSQEKEIEMPGGDFIAKVLEMNQVSSLKERCVVQVNFSKDVEEMKVSGKNRSGEMFVETSFLDKDGGFSHNSELAEKAFVVGDMEGLFNIRVDYTDGSTKFLKTFCSEGGYLVEQL